MQTFQALETGVADFVEEEEDEGASCRLVDVFDESEGLQPDIHSVEMVGDFP